MQRIFIYHILLVNTHSSCRVEADRDADEEISRAQGWSTAVVRKDLTCLSNANFWYSRTRQPLTQEASGGGVVGPQLCGQFFL